MSDQPKQRQFASPRYLKVLEKGLYGLYTDIIAEEGDPPVREKMGSIGPLKLLRERRKDDPMESVVLRTSHPADPARVIELVETEG